MLVTPAATLLYIVGEGTGGCRRWRYGNCARRSTFRAPAGDAGGGVGCAGQGWETTHTAHTHADQPMGELLCTEVRADSSLKVGFPSLKL